MLDWGKLPDLAAVVLLSLAFAAVARRSQTPVSGLWLTGWVMIALHFAAFIFLPLNGFPGAFAAFSGLTSLAWAGVLFMWASVPYRSEPSSRWMLATLLSTNALYLGLATLVPSPIWALTAAAAFFGLAPLAVAVFFLNRFAHPLRWMIVSVYLALSLFLLVFQGRPGNGPELALNAILFTVYLGCCLHFWLVYRRLTASALITTCGFLAWASVFVVAPVFRAFLPSVHLESEVWNLPKYVVAVGMILLVLEEQIEHNKHLALHDELTGLPNRRLFQDRLSSALERARRTGTETALLLVDLDHFKEVNDTVGHHIGDLVLMRVSHLFQGRVRRSDTVARTGGDEFSIILEEPTGRDDAERVSRSLMQLLEEPFELEGHVVSVGASVGIALFPEDAPNAEALRIAADLRMYARKYEARGRHFELRAAPPVGPVTLQARSGS